MKQYFTDYEVAAYHIWELITQAGYKCLRGEFALALEDGFNRPDKGETQRVRLKLIPYGGNDFCIEHAHAQIYCMDSGKYEVNFYIN